MPRRTHNPLLPIAALVVGLLLALGVAACGGGSQSAGTLETPDLTVGTAATLPSTASTPTTTTGTTSTTSTTGAAGDTGGAADTSGDTGAATGGDTGATGGGDAGGTGATGGGTAPATGGGGTTTPAQPANPGGAAPNYQSFCNENPGAC